MEQSKASQLNEYTINVGDGDWLTNDGSIAENEVVLLKFVSASGIAVISHTITNADISTRLVVQDVQLLPIQAPTCGLNLAITSKYYSNSYKHIKRSIPMGVYG